jgi:phage terminase large subunit-like protein
VKLIAAHHEARQETRLVNGTTILWRSATEPDRLRGINAGWAWVDEAASIDHEVWLVLLGRLRRAPERAWITTTPVGAQHWTAKLEAEGAHLVRAATRENKASAGRTGAKISQRKVPTAVIDDYRAALDFFADADAVKEVVQTLATRAIKAGLSVPGVRKVDVYQTV